MKEIVGAERIRVDDSSVPVQVVVGSASALIFPAPGDSNDHSIDWCSKLRSVDGRAEMLTFSKAAFEKAVAASQFEKSADSNELPILCYVYNVTPSKTVWEVVFDSEAEWRGYTMALTRKIALERMIERGVELIVLEESIAIVRSGHADLGNVVDVLVYSCSGQLQYSMVVEDESVDARKQSALMLLRSISVSRATGR